MNIQFENVENHKEDDKNVFMVLLNIKEFSEKFAVPIDYLITDRPTTAFEPKPIGVYMNFVGEVQYDDKALFLNGKPTIFEGRLQLQNPIHPETDVITYIYDNLSDDQIREQLTPTRKK